MANIGEISEKRNLRATRRNVVIVRGEGASFGLPSGVDWQLVSINSLKIGREREREREMLARGLR